MQSPGYVQNKEDNQSFWFGRNDDNFPLQLIFNDEPSVLLSSYSWYL